MNAARRLHVLYIWVFGVYSLMLFIMQRMVLVRRFISILCVGGGSYYLLEVMISFVLIEIICD